ncbi:Zinc-type alcohol dehydrogenase-like protein [Mycena kentingensis (nom. inval.)]|nr:Zinc-type alcohol dehydrogenase-like protein [Mycena kentingensis (nom. inval.)]
MATTPTTTGHYYLPKFGDVSCLSYKTSPIPALKPGEALVKVHAVSLQARDIIVVRGHPAARSLLPCPTLLANMLTRLVPRTSANVVPGSDMAGEIVALCQAPAGEGEWKLGDRVCANMIPDFLSGELTPVALQSALGAESDGVLTEYKVLPVHSLVKIPEHLSFEEASTLPCAALTAYNAVHGASPNDTVLIEGTGGVATFALRFAAAKHATTIVTSSSSSKLAQASLLGATHTINYNTTQQWDEEVLRLTGGVGVDLVVELGGPATLVKSLNAVRMGGSIAIVGMQPAPDGTPGGLTDVVLPTILKGIKMRGIQTGSVELFREMMSFIEAHPEQTRPAIAKVFSFAETRAGYEYFMEQGHVGKVVIRVCE